VKSSLRWRIAQQLEVKWWQNYLRDKSPETYLPWKKAYWEKLLQELSPSITLANGMQVLDAGCGPAGIFMALEHQQVTAVDPLLEAYRTMPHFNPAAYPHVHFQALSIEAIKEESRYDVIFCLNAINHVADIDLAYDQLVKAIKPGGLLVVSIDAHNHAFLKHIFRLLPGDALHPHQYDLQEYAAFLEDRGLVIQQTLLKTPGKIFNYYVQVAMKPA
jgi:2-polyprenyl-6-hydroxyphenyl methylase/3-demethylubiquinone-9 3-methyltransferase